MARAIFPEALKIYIHVYIQFEKQYPKYKIFKRGESLLEITSVQASRPGRLKPVYSAT